MKADAIFDAIGELREDLIADAETSPFRPRRGHFRNLMAACLTVLLLAVPVSAEMRTGYISNLLAPLYGNAQTELVDSVGVPIGASCTVAGYTLTADAVIGDRYNIAVVYSLTREDGGELPEGLRFDTIGMSAFGGGSGGGSVSQKMSEDRKVLKIIEEWTGGSRLFLFQRKASPSFHDLIIRDRETNSETLWQKGVWKLQFTIRYEDTTKTFRFRNREAAGYDGIIYTIKRACLSPIGLHLDLTGLHPDTGHMQIGSKEYTEALTITADEFQVGLRLTDGTRIDLDDWNMAGHGSESKKHMTWDYGASFAEPIPIENVQSIIICGTEIPLE